MTALAAIVLGGVSATGGSGSFIGVLFGALALALICVVALAVTLGTMGAYRGLAFIIGSEAGYTGFDAKYKWLGAAKLGSSSVPVMLIVFIGVVLVFGALMHYTTFGRRCFAIGNNALTAAFGARR